VDIKFRHFSEEKSESHSGNIVGCEDVRCTEVAHGLLADFCTGSAESLDSRLPQFNLY
jgi:hypothetical protein